MSRTKTITYSEDQKERFQSILKGMKSVGTSCEFAVVRTVKVKDDDFKLFISGNYTRNPDTTDEDGNGGHFTGEALADYLESHYGLFNVELKDEEIIDNGFVDGVLNGAKDQGDNNIEEVTEDVNEEE